jgi:formylglycine-generating enzyme required for sulfatase activity
MLLVVKPGGGQLYVDARPVSAAAFREVFARREPAARPDAPITNVSYNEARSFASTRGGRLPTAEEWDAASRTANFVTDGMYEWVESPGDKKSIRQRDGKSDIRADAAHGDVTFRVAQDLR